MTILDHSSGPYILTVTLQVDKEGERIVRKMLCKKGLVAIAGFEDEGEGHKPRNRKSF